MNTKTKKTQKKKKRFHRRLASSSTRASHQSPRNVPTTGLPVPRLWPFFAEAEAGRGGFPFRIYLSFVFVFSGGPFLWFLNKKREVSTRVFLKVFRFSAVLEVVLGFKFSSVFSVDVLGHCLGGCPGFSGGFCRFFKFSVGLGGKLGPA